jgi:hypothetical protein
VGTTPARRIDVRRIRQLSTKRLIASTAGLVVAVGAGTTIALAAGGGPTPPPRPLDKAIRHSLAGPAVPGVSARIQFTNHLIDSSGVEGVDPILKGASGRLWASADGRLRIELQADDGGRGDAIAAIDHKGFSVYDPASNTLYRGDLPPKKADARHGAPDGPPSLGRIDRALAKLSKHARLSGAQPSSIGGQAAYTVKAAPKANGGLLGGLALAWDSSRAVPLKGAVYAKGSSDPVLELKATHISYGSIAGGDLAPPHPPGAKVVDLSSKASKPSAHERSKGNRQRPVEGLTDVRKALPFSLKAPATLGGRARSGVKLIGADGHPAALVTYGRDLGGIAVIEAPAKPGNAAPARTGRHHHGRELSLPKVSVNGRPGQQLETALGSLVRFDRGGVSYVVIGSVRPATALAAARGL